MTKLKGFKLLNLDNLQEKLEKIFKSVFKSLVNQFLLIDFVYSRIFTNISGKIKLDTFSFLVKGLSSFLVAKHSKCILTFMGGSVKMLLFENS